ncbi:MAG: hypothetical protein RL131_1380, partial [Bacteroidota bacterium]
MSTTLIQMRLLAHFFCPHLINVLSLAIDSIDTYVILKS